MLKRSRLHYPGFITMITMASRCDNLKLQWTRFCITYLSFLWISLPIVTSQQVNTEIGTVQSYVGGTATLQCDLKNVFNSDAIIWFRPDVELYISYDDNVYSDVPMEIQDRVSLTCDRPILGLWTRDTCWLTITNVTIADNGSYSCGYEDTAFKKLTTGFLEVSYGDLPSEDSPMCNVLTRSGDGLQEISTGRFAIDDDVTLQCNVDSNVTLAPFLFWTRDKIMLNSAIPNVSLSHQVNVDHVNIDVEFTCVMMHPALDRPQNCSVILTKLQPSPTMKVAILSTSTAQELQTTFAMTTNKDTTSSSSTHVTVFIVPFLLILLIASILILRFLIWRKRRKNPIPTNPDYGLTIDLRAFTITADFAAVHSPDSIDKALDLHPNSEPSSIPTERPSPDENGAKVPVYAKPDKTKKKDDDVDSTFPVYAKPNKRVNNHDNDDPLYDNVTNKPAQYENLPQSADTDDGENGMAARQSVTYAELDLPVSLDTHLPTRNSTIYADIIGTL